MKHFTIISLFLTLFWIVDSNAQLVSTTKSVGQASTVQVFRDSSDLKGPRVSQPKKGAAVVGPNIHIHPNSPTTQSEMSIITHPTNPNILLVGSNALIPPHPITFFLSEGWYFTSDGGTNWAGRDTFATHTGDSLKLEMSDPAVGIDLDGNLFFNTLYVEFDSLSLPKLGDLIVAKSTDQGISWTQTLVPNSLGRSDKPHLVIDVNSTSPFVNYLYSVYTHGFAIPKPVKFSRSTDRGVTFSNPVDISGSITGSLLAGGANLAVGPAGELYATWTAQNSGPAPSTSQLGFNKSTDGGATWGTAFAIGSFTDTRGVCGFNKGGNCIRSSSFPSMSVDRSTGPRRGWIYIVYAARNSTIPDIFLVRSTDGGDTWSAPRIVNQDNSTKDQWMNWISVDPITGALFVVYYDSRNFPNNDSAQVYVSFSLDGGESFEDVLVSDVPHLPAKIPVPPPIAGGYMGDYIGISALNGVAWPCWNDNRTGIHQAYTSRIALINVGGPPTTNVSADTLNFGNVFIGHPDTLGLYVRNLSFPDTLYVTEVSSDNGAFTPDKSSFALPGASNKRVNIVFSPVTAGLSTATLTIASNDTAHPNVTVALRAYVLPVAPTLVSPPNGAANQQIAPIFTWRSTGASFYRLQVSTSSGFATTVYDDSTVTDTSRQITSLANSTIYYWRVRAKVNGVNGPYSSFRFLTTIIAAPASPLLVSPPNGAVNQPTTITLSWNASASAASYHLLVSADSTFTTTSLDDSLLTTTSWEVGGLANDTEYFWMVRAQNIGGTSAWSQPWNFTTAPREVTIQLKVTNRWSMISVPAHVENGLMHTIFPSAISSAYSYDGLLGYVQKDTLLAGIGYWLRFGAAETLSLVGAPIHSDTIIINAGWNLIGSVSDPIALNSIASEPPGIVTSRLFGYDGRYFMTDTIEPGAGYWIKTSVSGMLLINSAITSSASSRVRVIHTPELPPASPGEYFSVMQKLPKTYELEQNYPNPFNPESVIRYSLPRSGYVILRIFNSSGQVVKTLVDGVENAGYKSVIFDASALPSGIYFCRLQAGDFIEVRKMALVK